MHPHWHILGCVAALALTASDSHGADQAAGAAQEYRLAIVLDTEQPLSSITSLVLSEEVARLLAPGGITVEFYPLAAVIHLGIANRLVTARLQRCTLLPANKQSPLELVPLAWVTSTDGEVLSTIHVDCGLVGSQVGSATVWTQQGLAQSLMGRALARVLLHELLHILTGTAEHTGTRLFSNTMSLQTLIEPGLGLEPRDIGLLRESLPR